MGLGQSLKRGGFDSLFDSNKALSEDSILWRQNALLSYKEASLVRQKASLLLLCIIRVAGRNQGLLMGTLSSRVLWAWLGLGIPQRRVGSAKQGNQPLWPSIVFLTW